MYKALLVAPDGDWTTDHRRDTIEEVEQALADQGSRWYFYPFHAVIRDNALIRAKTNRLVSCAPPFEHLKGRTIRTFCNTIRETPEQELQAILEG